MKNQDKTTCDPCERDFEKNIDKLVKEGEAPTRQERDEREEAVKEAFARKEPVHGGETSR